MTTQTLTTTGTTSPIAIIFPVSGGYNPGIIANISSGGSLTYSIEATGDDINAKGYSAANGVWNALDNMSGLTASANATLIGLVTAVRANCTVHSSGTLTLQVIQIDAADRK